VLNPPLIIIGAGGQAVSVANVALSAGFAIRCFVDQARQGSSLMGSPVIGAVAEWRDLGSCALAIAMGDNAARQRVYQELTVQHAGLQFPCLIHRSAVVSSFVEIGEGTVVMPGAIVGPNTLVGRFCVINTRASIDHDGSMQDFSSLGPAAVTGGTVQLGERCAVGIGAVLKHRVKVGNDSVVGAHSYLNKDLPSFRVAYGTPARDIRARQPGEAYL
jgi:sugar O-acyltransferase (sialic acid O-acetyltransferase NeuD family)